MKKGQVELMESIMVLVVVVIVLILGIFFYFTFLYKGIEETGTDMCFQSSDILLSSVVSMPEIQCSENTREKNCVDAAKLTVFDPGRKYVSMFATNCPQRVYFEQVYPVGGNITCTEETYPVCTFWNVYEPLVEPTGRARLTTPVSLYFPDMDEYKMGRLVVEVYS